MVASTILQKAVAPDELWSIRLESLQSFQMQHLAAAAGQLQIPQAQENYPQPELYVRIGAIAVIEVNGILGKNLSSIDKIYFGGVDCDDLGAAIREAAADPFCELILFWIRSPGGMAVGIPELGELIASIEDKPTVAFTDFCCCSAAAWLATQCDEIWSTPSAIHGSIGVNGGAYLDWSGYLEEQGIKANLIAAGKFKMAGSIYKPMTDEERANFQARVDAMHAQFMAAVNLKRTVDPENMQGQSFNAEQAIEAGLCDGIAGSFDELLQELERLTH